MPNKPDPKISTSEAVLIGMFVLTLDAIDLIPFAGDLTDIAAAPLLLYYYTKHINGLAFVIAEVLDAIPLTQEFPSRTIVWVGTVAFDRFAPAEVEKAVEAAGEKMEGGEGGVEGEGELGAGAAESAQQEAASAEEIQTQENVGGGEGGATEEGGGATKGEAENETRESSQEKEGAENEPLEEEEGGRGKNEEEEGGNGEEEEEDEMAAESERSPEEEAEMKDFSLNESPTPSNSADAEDTDAPSEPEQNSGTAGYLDRHPEENWRSGRRNSNNVDGIRRRRRRR